MSDMRTIRLTIRVRPSELRQYERVSRAQHKETLSAWMRAILDAEVKRHDAETEPKERRA